MKLSVLQENLTKALSITSRSVSTRAQLPILNNILLTTDSSRLKLSATNLETGINYWIGAKIEKKGMVSIPAKVLTEFVATLPSERIELEAKGNNLNLTCGLYQANFVGLPASEFPSVPTLKNKKIITFNFNDLYKAISQVAFAAAQDESRPVLAGILVVIKNKNLILVATDGYRLSVKKIVGFKELKEAKKLEKGLIIPARTLMEVARIIGEQEQEKKIGLTVSSDSNQVIFSTPEAEIVSRLIEGDFPEFEKVIPNKSETKVIVETETLIKAAKMASIFARESANIVRVEIRNSSLKVSANTAQVGSNVSEIRVKTEGKKNKIAFNSRYLLDFLNSIETEQISFQMSSPLNPGVFKPVGDNSFLHIIMPVRVQE